MEMQDNVNVACEKGAGFVNEGGRGLRGLEERMNENRVKRDQKTARAADRRREEARKVLVRQMANAAALIGGMALGWWLGMVSAEFAIPVAIGAGAVACYRVGGYAACRHR